MRSPHSRPRTALLLVPVRVRARGFSMVELLVTIIIASIVFAAMVPFFANALSRTSEDELRVDSTNIAQERIEQIRLLSYAEVTVPNLTTVDTSFGDGRFGPSYTLIGESNPYTVTYEVTPADAGGDVPQKVVTVHVTRGDGYVTTAHTIIKNPAAGESTSSDAEPTDLTMTVYFDNPSYVKSPGVVIRRVRTNVTPNATTTPTPTTPWTSGATQVKYMGLIGGPNYTYTIMCHSNMASYVLTAPPFRMWSSGRLKFDTYPGGD